MMLGSQCSPCCGPPLTCGPLANADRCLRITATTSSPANRLSAGDSWSMGVGFRSRWLGGDIYHMRGLPLEVHFVQSQVTVTLRITASASFAPAIGVTETVVRRFNVVSVTNPPSATYDDLGPPWHLEVSISVTRVANNEPTGVTESTSVDEYGQPRLVVDVRIANQTIEHPLLFTLKPTGRQRWRPVSVDLGVNPQQQQFALSESSRSSVAVSGRSSLANVNKLTGIRIDALAVALRFWGSIRTRESSTFSASIQQRIVLNEESALAFLAGTQAVQTVATSFADSYGVSISAEPVAAECDAAEVAELGSETSCVLAALNFYGPPNPTSPSVPGTGGTTTGTVLFSGDALTCWSFLPLFDRQYSDSARIVRSSLPCNSCTVSAQVTTGADLAYTVVHASGLRAGTFDVIATRPFLAGEQVVVTAICGGAQVERTIKRRETPPDVPANLVAVREPCQTIVLTWSSGYNGGTPIIGHDVEIRPIGLSAWTSLAGETADPTYTATGLLRIGYEFRVRATNQSVVTQTGGNRSAYSQILAVGFALAAPSNLVATRGPCTEVALAWTPPQQSECVVVVDYRVQYRVLTRPVSTIQFGQWVTVARPASIEPAATVTGLQPETVYEFRVARLDERQQSQGLAPDDSQYSAIVRVGGVPPRPTNMVAFSGDGQITITWEGAQDQCLPTIAYSVTVFSLDTEATVAEYTEQPVVLTGLTNGTQYTIQLSARNSFGRGPQESLTAVPGL